MDNFFKREEKTATDNQVKASVKTMLEVLLLLTVATL